jgi:hypothetical protein
MEQFVTFVDGLRDGNKIDDGIYISLMDTGHALFNTKIEPCPCTQFGDGDAKDKGSQIKKIRKRDKIFGYKNTINNLNILQANFDELVGKYGIAIEKLKVANAMLKTKTKEYYDVSTELDMTKAILNGKLQEYLDGNLMEERAILKKKQEILDEKTKNVRNVLENEYQIMKKEVDDQTRKLTNHKHELDCERTALARTALILQQREQKCKEKEDYLGALEVKQKLGQYHSYTITFDAKNTPHNGSKVTLKHINNAIRSELSHKNTVLVDTDLKLCVFSSGFAYYGNVYGTATFRRGM